MPDSENVQNVQRPTKQGPSHTIPLLRRSFVCLRQGKHTLRLQGRKRPVDKPEVLMLVNHDIIHSEVLVFEDIFLGRHRARPLC